jgi:CHAT domain-containing protein
MVSCVSLFSADSYSFARAMVKRRMTLLISFLLLFVLSFIDRTPAHAQSVIGNAGQPAQAAQMTTLKSGEAAEGKLKGDEIHLYEIRLNPGQFVHIVLDQRGIDVVLSLIGPDGAKLFEADRPNGQHGPEELFWIAGAQTKYRLEVIPLEATAPFGEYTIKIAEVRQSTDQDQKRLLAQEALSRGLRLRGQTNAEPQQAVKSFSDSLKLWLATDELSSAAYAAEFLAGMYWNTGETQKAIESYQQALLLHKSARDQFGELAVLQNLGNLSRDTRETQKALEYYQQAISLAQTSGDQESEANTLREMGTAYSNILENYKSLECIERELVLRKAIGDRTQEGITLLNLGITYWDVREYQKSLNYAFQALSIFRSLGNRIGQAKALYHIGWVYFSLADNQKAIEYLQHALPLARSLGLQKDLLSTLDTLSRAWANSGNLQKALEYYQQEFLILKNTSDSEAIAQATTIMGVLYSQLDDPQKALEYLQRGLQLHKEAGNRSEEATTLNALGWLYYTQGDVQKAADYYQASLEIWKALHNSDWLATVLYNLAELSYSSGSWEQAEKQLTESLELEESHLANNLLSGIEQQQKFSLQQLIKGLHLSISINARFAPHDVNATRLALITLLRRKGRILDFTAEEYAGLRRYANAETTALLNQLNQYISKQSQLELRGPENASLSDYQAKLNDLREKIEGVQLKLKASSSRFKVQSQLVSLEAVQQNIPHDAALVEFSVWAPFERANNSPSKLGKLRYIAYLLFDHGDPVFVDLGEVREINDLAIKLGGLLREPFAEISEIKKSARQLDEIIMRPIRRRLETQQRLLIAPDSQLNLVPFAALVDERGAYLLEKYKISYLTSGRDLLRLQIPRTTNEPPLIIANPDLEDTTGWSASQASPGDQSRSGSLMQMKWTPIPGAESEAKALKDLMPSALLRIGKEATEAEVKQTNAPSVLHFATHGFFLPDLPRVEPSLFALLIQPFGSSVAQVENPMLRSGLVLAGANQKHSGEDDGVLTAVEMARLNLWGTKLVVLSACNTGVGDIEVGEGVYGLRRAMVLAGAEAQVMSLWKVDDSATAKLMIAYYTNLLKKGEGRADALREVQLWMLSNENTKHPYFWAGFIESGAWTAITEPTDAQMKTKKK